MSAGETAPVDWFRILQVVQSIAIPLAGVVAWVWNRQRKTERALLNARFTRLTERQDRQAERQKELEDEFEQRVEQINRQLSIKLMPCIQELSARVDRMPEALREKFLPLDLAKELIDESRRDRAAIWNELAKRGGRGHPR